MPAKKVIDEFERFVEKVMDPVCLLPPIIGSIINKIGMWVNTDSHPSPFLSVNPVTPPAVEAF
jgi:hypothetical protein